MKRAGSNIPYCVDKRRTESGAWRMASLVVAAAILVLSSTMAGAETTWARAVPSADGVPISYEVHGTGEPALIFVHGWSCDSRYWRAQVPYFSRNHQVVTLDLAGHGHSGVSRESYSMDAFGQDVRAVVEAVGSERVILIGHSMGGPVIAEAARLIPERVIGLIGVDTYQNLEMEVTQEGMHEWLAPLQAGFREGSRNFVEGMFVPTTDQDLRQWIVADMSAAPPDVAISAMREMLSDYMTGEAAAVFDNLEIPVVAVNADLWPTDIEVNRRHMHSFDAIIMEGADHFLMMNQPEEFNQQLETAIEMVIQIESKTDR